MGDGKAALFESSERRILSQEEVTLLPLDTIFFFLCPRKLRLTRPNQGEPLVPVHDFKPEFDSASSLMSWSLRLDNMTMILLILYKI
jgi:hypothetical protein